MSDRPPAMLLAEARGLDFLNSIATPADAPVDWLADGAGLIDWLRQAGLAPDEALAEIAGRAMPGELDRVADQARDLREWFRSFVRAHMGRPLGADALRELEPLNRLLARDEAYGRIVAHGQGGHGHLAFEMGRRWRSPEALLIPLGEAMARVVVGEDFTQVRACEGERCTLVFADHTRGRARRWCSMAICGNRAKQKDFRERRRAAAGPGPEA
jgi:predicted RNA-binding Zn ribbon-like protein